MENVLNDTQPSLSPKDDLSCCCSVMSPRSVLKGSLPVLGLEYKLLYTSEKLHFPRINQANGDLAFQVKVQTEVTENRQEKKRGNESADVNVIIS